MASKNPFGKSRKPGNAYLVIEDGGWKWEILKLYKALESSAIDPYARAFCFVHGIADEYGDVYLHDIGHGSPGANKARVLAGLKAVVANAGFADGAVKGGA